MPRNYLRYVAAFATVCAAMPAVAAPGAIDDRQTVALQGNTRPEARLTNDRGRLADDFALDHMQLLLKRSPEIEAALATFVDSLQDKASPNYHHWLTAADYGAKFGPSDADIAAVTGWLTAHGFTVNGIATGRMTIDFSGNAGQVGSAFHTEMHRLSVRGVSHIANMSDPQIPAALSGVITGVVSLNDFRPHTNVKKRPAYTFTSEGETYQAVVPGDLATIYNLTPLFTAGITGTGQTVVVIEDTNVYSTTDWKTFRTKFGLSSYSSGSFVQVHPTGSNSCGNPGVVSGNEGEAELDAEWSSASAPNATIELAACSDTSTTFGGLLALQNLIEAKSLPPIVSISYGECEAENGAAANAAFNTTYEQAAAEGISVFVSSGDEGAASCDADQSNATHGIGVSGFASSPYVVAVGGTDFGDLFLHEVSRYWQTANSSTFESAKSYVVEIPWNDSCASLVIAQAAGYKTSEGSAGYCNSTAANSDSELTTAGGSGGPSGCATGAPSVSGVVSGTCKGYVKPSWQKLIRGYNTDGLRDIPDVSLFAANGVWGHYYVYCDSDIFDGESCSGAPSNWSGAGGTSFSSPILAGIQALVNQKQGAPQGLPNPVYYALARSQYGGASTTGASACDSRLGGSTPTNCVFHDVGFGDISVNCTSTHNCYLPSGTYGILSTSDSADVRAYAAHPGMDFTTGLGSVNAANLVNNWSSGQ